MTSTRLLATGVRRSGALFLQPTGDVMSIWLLIVIIVIVVLLLGGFGYSRR
jgi:LPXTG-motif cell wall-anchored protein